MLIFFNQKRKSVKNVNSPNIKKKTFSYRKYSTLRELGRGSIYNIYDSNANLQAFGSLMDTRWLQVDSKHRPL